MLLIGATCLSAVQQELLSDKWSEITQTDIKEWNETDRIIWDQVHDLLKTFNKDVVMPDEAVAFFTNCIKAASSEKLKTALSDEMLITKNPSRLELIYDKKAKQMGITHNQCEELTILFGPEDEAAILIAKYEKQLNRRKRGPFDDGPSSRELYSIYTDYAAEELGIKEKDGSNIDEGKLAYWKEIYQGASKADARHAEEMINLKAVKDEVRSANWMLRNAIDEKRNK